MKEATTSHNVPVVTNMKKSVSDPSSEESRIDTDWPPAKMQNKGTERNDVVEGKRLSVMLFLWALRD